MGGMKNKTNQQGVVLLLKRYGDKDRTTCEIGEILDWLLKFVDARFRAPVAYYYIRILVGDKYLSSGDLARMYNLPRNQVQRAIRESVEEVRRLCNNGTV
jgi:hypothetical protein